MSKRSYLEVLQEVPSDEIINCLKKAFVKWTDEVYQEMDQYDQERFLGIDTRELAETFIDEVIDGTSGCNFNIQEEFEDFELDDECEEYLADFVRSKEFLYEIKEHIHEMIEAA